MEQTRLSGSLVETTHLEVPLFPFLTMEEAILPPKMEACQLTCSINQTFSVVRLNTMSIFLNPAAPAMLLSTWSLCQEKTGTETQTHPQEVTTIVMPTKLVESSVPKSISWRPTPMPGKQPHMTVMHQLIRVTTTTVMVAEKDG